MHAKRPGGPPAQQPKRPRVDDDEDGFDDLDDMLEDEADMMMMDGQQGPDEPPDDFACLTNSVPDAARARWSRPALPQLDPASDAPSFQQLEADYTIVPLLPEFAGAPGSPGASESRSAVVRMYGVTQDGHSVLAHVHGFKSYFYVRAPPGFKPDQCEAFRTSLNARLKAAMGSKDQVNTPVLHIAPVSRQTIMNFNFNQPSMFLRLVVALPTVVPAARRCLEGGVGLPGGGQHSFETFESNWAYVMRFMVDRDIVGCNWLSLAQAQRRIASHSIA